MSYNSYLVDAFDGSSLSPDWTLTDWGGYVEHLVADSRLAIRTFGDIWNNNNDSCAFTRPSPSGSGWTVAVDFLPQDPIRFTRTLYIAETLASGSRMLVITEDDQTNKFSYVRRDTTNSSAVWTGGSPNAALSATNRWMEIKYTGSAMEIRVSGVLVDTVAIGWTPGYVGFGVKGQDGNGSTSGWTEFSNYAEVPSGGDPTELYDGPEPLNTVAPTLTISATSWSGTVGTWDSQSNGTVTYEWELRDGDDDSVVESGTGSSPSGSGSYSGDYYLWVRASNDGGYDSAEDSTSAVQSVGGGGPSYSPIHHLYESILGAAA
jgi:hypothetical protein